MSRSIFSGVIGAAVLLAGSFASQASFGQDHWNHGFGPRDYAYSGNAYSGNMYSRSYSYRSQLVDPGRYSNSNYRNQFCRPSYGLGGYSTGSYGYSTAPSNFGYRSYYAPYGVGLGIGTVPPTSPYYEPLGVHRHGNQLYAPIPGARAW